jgi:hypothetical protein
MGSAISDGLENEHCKFAFEKLYKNGKFSLKFLFIG